MTVTSLGYGDISATCRNYYEMAWAASIMLLGGIMWSQAFFKIQNHVLWAMSVAPCATPPQGHATRSRARVAGAGDNDVRHRDDEPWRHRVPRIPI